jgi:hypothetical protein
VRSIEHDSDTELDFLALSAKVATDSQFCRATGASSARAKRLARKGIIGGIWVLANPPTPLAGPVATFEFATDRQCAVPDFRALSRLLKARWPEPAKELFVVYATGATEDLTDGVGARITPLQLHHALEVTEALLASGIPRGWRSEAFLVRYGLSIGRYLPDAALLEGGKIVRAIEYGGLYEPGRVEACWRACYRTRTPLELW